MGLMRKVYGSDLAGVSGEEWTGLLVALPEVVSCEWALGIGRVIEMVERVRKGE